MNVQDINYIEINKKTWNNKTDIHINSEFYDNENFIKGKTSLNDIELNLLGDIKGKTILHLQCHFGQDTISFTRLGAKATGVDLSDKAVQRATELAEKTGSDALFICCNVYDLPQHLDEQFDIVFTSYGTIGWLPDINQWAGIVSRYLKPNGRFVLAEFHPVVWMFDDNFTKIEHRYFNSEPIIENEEGTYAETNADVSGECVTWNHGMAEVISSLLNQGLTLNHLGEYDYSPYNCLAHMEEVEPKKFRVKHWGDKVPMVYSIVATK